ncbi:MAG: hypothetical protein IPK59_19360 [Rhodospirillaceae bacterium]|nr:hypothetical protein [Rhodospirillaceae bacterium]
MASKPRFFVNYQMMIWPFKLLKEISAADASRISSRTFDSPVERKNSEPVLSLRSYYEDHFDSNDRMVCVLKWSYGRQVWWHQFQYYDDGALLSFAQGEVISKKIITQYLDRQKKTIGTEESTYDNSADIKPCG